MPLPSCPDEVFDLMWQDYRRAIFCLQRHFGIKDMTPFEMSKLVVRLVTAHRRLVQELEKHEDQVTTLGGGIHPEFTYNLDGERVPHLGLMWNP